VTVSQQPQFEARSRNLEAALLASTGCLKHTKCVVKYPGEDLHGSSVARIGFVRDRDRWPEDQSRTTGESFGTNQPASSLVN
jgi:hypothetical protein